MHQLVLTYFDKLMGPTIKYILPENSKLDDQNSIQQLMDLTEQKGFFGHITGNDYISNYIFEIPSPIARGKKEILMLSFISDLKYDFNEIEVVFERYIDKFKNAGDLYFAFHLDDKANEEKSLTSSRKIKSILSECLKESIVTVNKQLFGKIYVIGLEHVGKSTLIHKIQSYGIKNDVTQQNITSNKIPIGLKILKILSEKIVFDIYDIKPSGHFYCYDDNEDPDAIIYVVDYNKIQEIPRRVIEQFDEMILHFFSEKCTNRLVLDTPVLIIGNKIDELDSKDQNFIEKTIKPTRFFINYHIGYISAKTNEGLAENFSWLINEFLKNAKFPLING